MSALDRTHTRCGHCDAVVRALDARCWLCGRRLDGSGGLPARGVWTFGLGSLLLLVTLTAVVCGVATIDAAWGIIAGTLGAAAFVRTALASRHLRRLGSEPGFSEVLSFFGQSVALVCCIGLAAGFGFYAASLVGQFGLFVVLSLLGKGTPEVVQSSAALVALGVALGGGAVGMAWSAVQLWPYEE